MRSIHDMFTPTNGLDAYNGTFPRTVTMESVVAWLDQQWLTSDEFYWSSVMLTVSALQRRGSIYPLWIETDLATILDLFVGDERECIDCMTTEDWRTIMDYELGSARLDQAFMWSVFYECVALKRPNVQHAMHLILAKICIEYEVATFLAARQRSSS